MTRIDTVDQLDALPIGSIVIDSDCDVMHKAWDPKTGGDHWSHMGTERAGNLWLPVVLVRVPGRDLVQEAKAVAWDACARSMVYSDGTPVEIISNTNPYRQEAPSAHPS